MCKNAQNHEKLAKMPKIAQKSPKTITKRVKKTKLSTSVKINTHGAAASAIFFHLCSRYHRTKDD